MFALLMAFAAAACYGAGTSLQHRAASGVPRAGVSTAELLARLVRRRSWLLGLGVSGVAFALHVAALHLGSLPLVQPVVVGTIVFAVLVRDVLDRQLPARREVAWALCTWVGLALFVSMVHSRTTAHPASDRAALMVLLAGAAITGLSIVVARSVGTATAKGFLLAVAAGIMYGLTASLIKVVTASTEFVPLAILRQPWFWALLAVGVAAVSLSQRAYHTARLAVTVPVLNIVEVSVAVMFGAVVFRDRLFTSPAELLVEVIGFAAMALGVWQLARQEDEAEDSPLAHGSTSDSDQAAPRT